VPVLTNSLLGFGTKMGTVNSSSDILAAGKIFLENQEEALHKDGHQNWHRVVLYEFEGSGADSRMKCNFE